MEKKKIVIVVSGQGKMIAGVFEFEVSIRNHHPSGKIYIKPEKEAVKDVIRPIGTFLERKKIPPVRKLHYGAPTFGSCVIGSNLYMIPDERDMVVNKDGDLVSRLTPCVFNLVSKREVNYPLCPLGMKIFPLVVAVDKKIYACSFSDCVVDVVPEPTFETLDPIHESTIWNELCYNSVFNNKANVSKGYVVLEDKFILVCLSHMLMSDPYYGYIFYSFNTRTGSWKPVRLPPTEAYLHHNSGLYLPVMKDQSVVIGKDIYMYSRSATERLMVFSYTDISHNDPDHDLELSPAIVVKGFKSIEVYSGPFERLITGVVLKVDHQILCLINTVCIENKSVLQICVTFIKLERRDFCTHLSDFRCRLENGDQLPHPRIASSFVLHQKKGSDRHRRRAGSMDDWYSDSAIHRHIEEDYYWTV